MLADAPQVRALPGERLHLAHGPIDVVLRAWGEPDAIRAAYAAAAGRFPRILPELCAELALLRQPVVRRSPAPGEARGSLLPRSAVGRRMAAACLPFADLFVTPMAAVAGAVADELLAAMLAAAELERAYVNDGGDIAVHCTAGAVLDVGVAGAFGHGPVPVLNGSVRIRHGDGIAGIATSGARGRSFSLGIADSVTVLAADAATADTAATLIANAVDIDHPAVVRRPASALDPDSDLGDRPVTVDVGALPDAAVRAALESGRRRAADYLARGLIADAALMLAGKTASVFSNAILTSDPEQRWATTLAQGIGSSRTQNAGRAATEGMSPCRMPGSL